jgi:hypothetical protein
LEALVDGAAAVAGAAASHLDSGERTDGVAGIDAGLRLTAVGQEVTRGSLRWAFTFAHRELELARTAVEDGHSGARGHLRNVVDALRTTTSDGGLRDDLSRASVVAGATVLNDYGAVIGEVDGVRGTTATIREGGVSNVFGMVDFGGSEVDVPVTSLVGADVPRVGERYVVAPVFGARLTPIAGS